MSATQNGNAKSIYQNPERKPLEKLDLLVYKDGNLQPIPALGPEWLEGKIFSPYEPPRIYDSEGKEILGAKDDWLGLASDITKNLQWLLRLRFYKFWSNVVWNHTIFDCIVSCLQEFPTFYNMEKFPKDAAMRETLETIRHRVFLTLVRLVVSKESKDEFLTCEKHGSLLYNNYLLTVPMMLDICQHYGRENRKIVEKILTTSLKLQPAYGDDFERTTKFFVKAFKTIDETFKNRPIPLAAGPVLLSEDVSHRPLTMDDLEDMIIHLLDVSSNISVFLECFPPANDLLCSEDFINEIVYLYGNTIPEMYKRLETMAYKDETIAKYAELKHCLDASRIELLKIFRTITYHNIERILNAPNPSEVPGASEHVEQFINFLDKAVTEREFMLDYFINHPIEKDLDLVSLISHDIDPVKRRFIERSVYAELSETDRGVNSQPSTSSNAAGSSTAVVTVGSEKTVTNPTPKSSQRDKTMDLPASKDPAQLASLIQGVKDILCDLGEGFIEKCLVHYDYNVTEVINAVFEDSLPENLKTLDRTLPYIPPDPAEPSAAIDRALGRTRLNVFDNDEFDVMTRDTIDQSRVHKGKRKDKYKNFGQLLDDKSHRQEMSNVYEKYSLVQDEYDDEYDDTYDSHEVGPCADDEQLEMDGRAFTTPRVLRWNGKADGDEENEAEEDDHTEKSEGSSRAQNNHLNFVQDPAELRARAEQRRQSKRGGAGGSKGSQGDVIGKPKGQGNDKNVLINRDRKNANKASRGNHNRRSGAEHKRRQGMMP